MRLEAGASDAHLDHGRCNGGEAQTDQGQSGGVEDSGNPREALARVLDDVRQRWGASSLVYLEARKPDAGTSVASRHLLRSTPGTGDTADARSALPAWWPGATTRDGRALTVPPVLEVSGQVGGGRLTFALAWAGALRPTLLALVDIPGDHGGRIFPPSLQVAGLSLPTQVIVVRPPPGPTPRETTRAVLDALFIMLRSEAFDAIVCPLPEGARVGLAAASTIASLTARTGTALLVLAGPGRAHGRTSSRTGDFTARTGVLGPAASYRLVLEDHHWEWRDGEIGGLTLRVQTHRRPMHRILPGRPAVMREWIRGEEEGLGPRIRWRSTPSPSACIVPRVMVPFPVVAVGLPRERGSCSRRCPLRNCRAGFVPRRR
jgi:hypothetical protein